LGCSDWSKSQKEGEIAENPPSGSLEKKKTDYVKEKENHRGRGRGVKGKGRPEGGILKLKPLTLWLNLKRQVTNIEFGIGDQI